MITDEVTKKIILPVDFPHINLYGEKDSNLKLIQKNLNVKIIARGDEIFIKGDKKKVLDVEKLFNELIKNVSNVISEEEIKYAIKMIKKNNSSNIIKTFNTSVLINYHNKEIKPNTIGQKKYIDALMKYDMVFAIGPAGTGKTYLAVALAMFYLKNKKVSRVILTRPVVEAGEKLGFLPGDIQEKVNPYFRPIYDALYDIIGIEKAYKLLEEGIIEIAPLAYMRGRTLNDSFIILDEAQNTTCEQMKMFITRLGFFSRAVITGDITQIDLENSIQSGLVHISSILKGIKGIKFVYLNKLDVVRHNLVKKIIKAYEMNEKKNGNFNKKFTEN